MWSKRAYVDFALKKRATIASIYRGLNTTSDACDADPYLRRAAKHHGELTNRDCPMCHKDKVHELQYTFGDQLGQYSGRIKTMKNSKKCNPNMVNFVSMLLKSV